MENGKFYKDNDSNRKYGRVGLPWYSAIARTTVSISTSRHSNNVFAPLEQINPETADFVGILNSITKYQYQHFGDKKIHLQCEIAKGILYRHEASLSRSDFEQLPSYIRLLQVSDLEIGEKIGGGGYGDVHVAIWKPCYRVAIKNLNLEDASEEELSLFRVRMTLLDGVKHPALMTVHEIPKIGIYMEFMPAGSLYDVLHVEKRPLRQEQKKQIITDCLSGLSYLHQSNYTHTNLKSRNVLLSEDFFHCKLTDLRMAVNQVIRNIRNHPAISETAEDASTSDFLRYASPEVLQGQRLPDDGMKKVDIYAISAIIVEVLTEIQPFDGLKLHQIREAVLAGEQPPMICVPENIKILIKQGMSKVPKNRPTATKFLLDWEFHSAGAYLITPRLDALRLRSNSSTIGSSATSVQSSSQSRTQSKYQCGTCDVIVNLNALVCGHLVCRACLPKLKSCNACGGPVSGSIRIQT